MSNREFRKVKGFQDITGDVCAYWKKAEKTVIEVFDLFNIQEMRLPMLEHTELFARGVGETTDIVEKEMFTFMDRESKNEEAEMLTMRPEGTAGVVRSYIENGMYNPPLLKKFYYLGSMFRREKPQKGRYRQFTQAGIEYIGTAEPFADADVINVLYVYFNQMQLGDFVSIEINSVGCPDCRPAYQKILVEYFSGHKEDLCEDCNRRLLKNPLRILDCKNERCKTITTKSPIMLDHLCQGCSEHFDEVKKYLGLLGVSYKINPMMVRGLDYYVRTAFEVVTDKLGTAGTLGGGGRYDGLVKTLGGPDIAGVGFAMGVDRIIELMKYREDLKPTPPVAYIITFPETLAAGIQLLNEFRAYGICTEIDYETKGLKNQMKKADRVGASYAVIVGEDELKNGCATIRNLAISQQEVVPLKELINKITAD